MRARDLAGDVAGQENETEARREEGKALRPDPWRRLSPLQRALFHSAANSSPRGSAVNECVAFPVRSAMADGASVRDARSTGRPRGPPLRCARRAVSRGVHECRSEARGGAGAAEIVHGLGLVRVRRYNQLNRTARREVNEKMTATKERYVVDEEGTRVGVLLDMDEYQSLLEACEELEAIRAYDAAKASGDEAVPFDQALREIEKNRG